jgi:hypothetical protein
VEIIYAAVIGAGLGVLLRYVLPGRETYGVALLPALAGIATLAVWVGMLWLGFTFDSVWIWLASLGAAAVVAAVVAVVVSRRRIAADAHALHVLSGGKA